MQTVRFAHMVQKVGKATGIRQEDVHWMLKSFFEEVISGLEEGNKVRIDGLGTFSVKRRQRSPRRKTPYVRKPPGKYVDFFIPNSVKRKMKKLYR